MAIKVKIKKASNRFDKLIREIHEVNQQWVEVGHFQEQGDHYSGYGYAELAALYHRGEIANQPPRRVLDALAFSLGTLNTNIMARIRNHWLQKRNTKEMLEMVARYIAKKEYDLFGKVGPFMPADSTDTPLVEDGDLQASTAYRTSKDKTIKEIV